MKHLIILLFLPLFSYGQWFDYDEPYFSISTEVDVSNVLNLTDRATNGYDGVYNVSYRNYKMQMHITAEVFPNAYFQSYGVGGSYVINHDSPFNVLIGGTLSLIWRQVPNKERGHDPSAAINIQAEYHLNRLFVYARNEGRYRGDLKAMYNDTTPYVYSFYVGIGYKF